MIRHHSLRRALLAALLPAMAGILLPLHARAQTVPEIAPVPTNLTKYNVGVTPNIPGIGGLISNDELHNVVITEPGEYTFAYPVRGVTTNAISVKSDDVIIREAQVVGSLIDGIKSAGYTNVHFIDCNVRDCDLQGFAFHSMTDSSISGCTATNNGYNPNGLDKFYHGYYFSGDRIRFEDNTATDNADNGIQAYPYVRECVIRNNVSQGHDGPGHNRPDRTGYVINTAGDNFILTNIAHEPFEANNTEKWKFRWSGPPEDTDIVIGNYWQRLMPSSGSAPPATEEDDSLPTAEEDQAEADTDQEAAEKKKKRKKNRSGKRAKKKRGIRARGGPRR